MWTFINVDKEQDVDIEFDEENNERLIKQFEAWNETNKCYTKNDLDKLKDALEMLSNYSNYSNYFRLNARVDEIELSDDEVDDAYADIHGTLDTYEDGYDAAREEIDKFIKGINSVYGCLMQKLEHLAYGYGKQEPLTADEIKKLKELLDYKLK